MLFSRSRKLVLKALHAVTPTPLPLLTREEGGREEKECRFRDRGVREIECLRPIMCVRQSLASSPI
jgi:hypothetical protein